MDSPPIPLSPVDQSDPSRTSFWNSMKPLHRGALIGLVVSLAVGAALGFCSSAPLWRPIGALVLQKLWDVLRFLVITTSIVLALLNSRHPRRTSRLDSGKDDSFSSKLPFVGMFHGEVQQLHSYSFSSDKEVEVSEDGRKSKSNWEGDNANEATATETESGVGVSAATTRTDGYHEDEARTSSVPAMADNLVRANGIQYRAEEDGSVNAEASRNPSVYASQNAVSMRSSGQGLSRRSKAHVVDDLGLPAVAEEPRHGSSRIIHRRGKSLEFPIVQEEGTSFTHSDAATDSHTADTQEKRVSVQAQAALPAASGAPRHGKHRRGSSGSAAAGPGLEDCDTDAAAGGIRTAAFKHSRSRSAYSLNELLVQQQQQLQQRPRSKPAITATPTSQLSKRRNVSLSCDLDRGYTKGGVPAWLSSVPSPPTPPLVYCYGGDFEKGANRDDSSLRKAYTESLAPWRAAANAVPADISTEERKEAARRSHRKASTREMEKSSPPSSDPSTPLSMGSPSPRELNKKVDAFISRFHERMRLQRLESIERAKQKRGI